MPVKKVKVADEELKKMIEKKLDTIQKRRLYEIKTHLFYHRLGKLFGINL